ncbi:ATP binding protein [Artemisia annua]|uniref:Methyltransferase n=1 Tax=Artemisia annua TaxID=35608 RepID=A0A2U1MRY1_ARTAN|nr:ATP binding protein [Artemisia annua]
MEVFSNASDGGLTRIPPMRVSSNLSRWRTPRDSTSKNQPNSSIGIPDIETHLPKSRTTRKHFRWRSSSTKPKNYPRLRPTKPGRCEGFSTYPRTYDLVHANGLFRLYQDRCRLEGILLEMDRILRPEGCYWVHYKCGKSAQATAGSKTLDFALTNER